VKFDMRFVDSCDCIGSTGINLNSHDTYQFRVPL